MAIEIKNLNIKVIINNAEADVKTPKTQPSAKKDWEDEDIIDIITTVEQNKEER